MRKNEGERERERVNKFMGKVKSIASSPVQRVALGAFIFHFSLHQGLRRVSYWVPGAGTAVSCTVALPFLSFAR